jgi:hypothetical protein
MEKCDNGKCKWHDRMYKNHCEAYKEDLANSCESYLMTKEAPGSKVPCGDGLGREPLRIECGQGKIGVYDGELEDVPCLTLCDNGAGVIGEPNGSNFLSAIPQKEELVTVTFTKSESVDVFIRALERIKERL